MANSATDICNLALGHLGEKRITSLDEDSVAARACALHYETTLEEVLRSHRWNFAQTRAELTALADEPLFGCDYQYQLPADCLRVLEFNDSECGDVVSDQYIIEGRRLLTNASEAKLVYTKRITDVSAFDSLFVKALAVKLAVAVSETLRGSTGKTGELLQAYEKITAPLARRGDANEGRRRKGLIANNSLMLRARAGFGALSVAASMLVEMPETTALPLTLGTSAVTLGAESVTLSSYTYEPSEL